jgi:DNA-binding NarL/FixJ family response regulator
MSVGDGNFATSIRILLADDNEAILRHAEDLLAPHFEVVGTVPNGELLVKQAAALDPDVIVTDISMPLMSGLEAVAKIKKTGSRARVVFLSVFQQQSFVHACFSAGADGFVAKARLSRDLIQAVEEVLSGRQFGFNGRQELARSTNRQKV